MKKRTTIVFETICGLNGQRKYIRRTKVKIEFEDIYHRIASNVNEKKEKTKIVLEIPVIIPHRYSDNSEKSKRRDAAFLIRPESRGDFFPFFLFLYSQNLLENLLP